MTSADSVVAKIRSHGRDPIECRLLEIWHRVLGLDSIAIRDDFFDLGGTSVMAVRLAAEVEACFSTSLSPSTLLENSTLVQLAAVIRGRPEAAGDMPALVTIKPQGSELPIFLIHGAGGMVLYAQKLSRLLHEWPMYGFQSVGLYDSRPPLMSIEAMAARYVAELEASTHEPPYLIAGYSQGALIAVEMARRLEQHGRGVERLILIDAPARDDSAILAGDASEFVYRFMLAGIPGGPALDEFRVLGGRAQAALVLECWKKRDRIPPETGPEFVERYLAVTRANVLAAASYSSTSPYPGAATLIVAESRDPAAGHDAGWQALLPGLGVVRVPGDHLSMLEHPNVVVLAERLRHVLNRPASNGVPAPSSERPA